MKSLTKVARLILSGVLLIVLIAFNVVLFVSAQSYPKGASFWTGYAFVHLAFLGVVCSTLLSTRKDRDGVLFSLPLLYVSLIYLALEAIVGIVFMFLPDQAALWTGIVQGVMFAGYLVVILLSFLGLLFIKRNRDYVAAKVAYIATLKDEVAALALAEGDEEVKKALLRFAEDVRFSDPMSSDELAPMEEELVEQTRSLPRLEGKEAKLERLASLSAKLKERNARAKTLKR